MKIRSSSLRIWSLVGGLIALQFLIFAGGVAGILTVDTIRSYVAGEALFSKGEKRAAYHLRAFALSGRPSHYEAYAEALRTPKAFGNARILLERTEFELRYANDFLVQGGLDPDDVQMVSWFFRLLRDTELMADPLETWRAADRNIQAIESLAQQMRAYWGQSELPAAKRQAMVRRLDALDARQTELQTGFSQQMGRVAKTTRTYIIYGMLALTLVVAGAGALLARKTAKRMAEAEAGLRAGRELFRDIALTTSDWIWMTDAELRFTYFSDRMPEVTGTDKDSVLGLTPWELRPCDNSEPWQRLRARMENRKPFHGFEYGFRDREGQHHWFRITGMPYWDEQGRFAGYRGTGTDITEEVRARREAEDRRELLETTFETIPQGITVVGPDLRVKAFNRHFLTLLDFPADFFRIGDPFETFIRYNAARGEYGQIDDLDAFVAAYVEKAERFEPHQFERQRPDGTVLEVRGEPLPSGGFVTVYNDITERRRTEAELRRARDAAQDASRTKSAFLASMSHELRTPLNAIIGYSDVMANELLGPMQNARYRAYAENIHTSGQYLLSLVQDVLNLSRLEAGTLELEASALDLAHEVGEALIVQGEEPASRVRTRIEDGLTARAEARALRQVLVNVVGNALKFSGGADVELRAYAQDGWAVIEVTDHGPGIPAEDLPRVTEPFFTKARSPMTAPTAEGVGIGLAITRQLLDALGGELEIDSTVGQGTTVTVRLPLAEPQDMTDDAARSAVGT